MDLLLTAPNMINLTMITIGIALDTFKNTTIIKGTPMIDSIHVVGTIPYATAAMMDIQGRLTAVTAIIITIVICIITIIVIITDSISTECPQSMHLSLAALMVTISTMLNRDQDVSTTPTTTTQVFGTQLTAATGTLSGNTAIGALVTLPAVFSAMQQIN
jgi:hypothetical protein